MLPVAGNIQSAQKNCLSQNYPFRKDSDEPEHHECMEFPPTEYESNFVCCRYDNKPKLRRDLLREQFRIKATEKILRQAQERYEILHRQEEERMPLKKQPDYYMSRDSSDGPEYDLYKTADAMTTFWSYRSKPNASRRKNTNFTKPISEQLDQQFG
ncbi:uncharacterized protein LOC131685793 [Topomyia yanbarensis]|uniref:uncharacterized protein LOC131685793 n=1 Tax=Topomyia yanbarensis TaxID=2498891 RepID=UPI00273AF098|nr:uncharacterized protein LOC131685793 [Topomyia yanbarensis]